MEIIGSVTPDDVPKGTRVRRAREGVWSQVARRAVNEHEQGRIVVLKVKDDKELAAMRANLGPKLRAAGFKLRPVVVDQPDGIRVFLELRLRDERATAPVNSHEGLTDKLLDGTPAR